MPSKQKRFEEHYRVLHNDPVGDDMPTWAYTVFDEPMARMVMEANEFRRRHKLGRLEVLMLDDQVLFHDEDDRVYEDEEEDAAAAQDVEVEDAAAQEAADDAARDASQNVFLQINHCSLVICQDAYWFEARGGEQFEGIEFETAPRMTISKLVHRFGISYDPARVESRHPDP